MKTTIQKWGNSLGIRIPSYMAKDLSLENGSSVEILEEDSRIIIKPKRETKLDDILDLITDENIHSEQFDVAAGKELL